MKPVLLAAFLILLFSCNSAGDSKINIHASHQLEWFDSIPFGTVQPLLERNAQGEKLLRIDSIGTRDSSYTIFFVTDKGFRKYISLGKFKTLVIKGYKFDGSHSCLAAHPNGNMWVTTCKDSACTIVIDSVQLDRTVRPYPLLNPELGKADSCR